mgnify:CR=1 FL=1
MKRRLELVVRVLGARPALNRSQPLLRFAALIGLVVTPIVAFYMLVDWDRMLAAIEEAEGFYGRGGAVLQLLWAYHGFDRGWLI